MADNWSHLEIDLIVADYFAMLGDELRGRSYVKRSRNKALQQLIPRNAGSIEFKHQNISAVMLGLGQPWVEGYKPKANFQKALIDGVLRWLEAHPDWLKPGSHSGVGGVGEPPSLWIGPPPSHRNEPSPIPVDFMAALARKYDVAERDAQNRALGKAGEELVLVNERRTLAGAGRDDLARKVRWTAAEDGDGFGFDILSFEADGRDRLLEVKTTNGWDRTPFHISRNELEVANERREDWHLIRVWNFAREPKAFSLRPPLEFHVDLVATSFLAALH